MSSMSRGPGAVVVGGRAVPFRIDGDGPPLVLVHGSMSDHEAWDAPAARLVDHRTVIRPTLAYFGASPWPDEGEGYAADAHAGELAGFLEAVGGHPALLVGWSYGGAVCLRLASARPDLVRALVLYEPSLFAPVEGTEDAAPVARDREAMFSEARARVAEGRLDAKTAEVFVDGAEGVPGTFASFPEATRRMFVRNVRTLRPLFAGPPPPSVGVDDLRRIDAPTVLMLGAESRETWRRLLPRMADAIPKAELLRVASARHLWPIVDPPTFAERLLGITERLAV